MHQNAIAVDELEPNGSGPSATAANKSHDETVADQPVPTCCCVMQPR